MQDQKNIETLRSSFKQQHHYPKIRNGTQRFWMVLLQPGPMKSMALGIMEPPTEASSQLILHQIEVTRIKPMTNMSLLSSAPHHQIILVTSMRVVMSLDFCAKPSPTARMFVAGYDTVLSYFSSKASSSSPFSFLSTLSSSVRR